MDAIDEADSGNRAAAPHEQRTGRADREAERLRRQRDESDARFHALVESTVDGIVVVDRSGTMRYANTAAAELFGIEPSALIGTPFGYPMVAGQTVEIDALPRGRNPVVMEMRVVESQWEGERACIACLRDVTDRKRAEESARRLIRAEAMNTAARETTRRLRFLADASAALASSLDPRATLAAVARVCAGDLADWAIVFLDCEQSGGEIEIAHRDPALDETARALRDAVPAGPAADPLLSGLRASTFLSVQGLQPGSLPSLVPDENRRRLVAELGLASYVLVPISAGARRLGAIVLVRSDPGRPFQDDDIALALAFAGRAALALENARLYQAARAVDRAKTDLIAVISHDLRTPLNSIIGYAELLEMGVSGALGDQSREWVRRVRASAEHQVHLIDQLLVFSRAESGALELRPQRIPLAALLEEVRDIVAPLADRAGLTLAVACTDGLAARADPDALRQIVLNLATNAVKYTERGGVRLRADRAGDEVSIRVTDTGIGIEPAHVDRVFDPFWQARPGQRGTGLGLSIVRRLARALDGDVEVRSVPGRGSEFTLRLPAAE